MNVLNIKARADFVNRAFYYLSLTYILTFSLISHQANISEGRNHDYAGSVKRKT